jgi:cytoskeletal protein CcmA (bactofilin family)
MEQFQQKWSRFWQVVVVIAAVLSMVATAMAGLNFAANQTEEPVVARGASVPCYMEQGGAKFVAESGCEIEVQSGATFDLQSGATTDFSGGVDLDGATLTVDADGDTTVVEASDDVASLTSGTAAGYWNFLTGSVKIGNGTVNAALNGEDLYVEGTLDVDGAAYIQGNVSDADGAFTVADNTVIDGASDAAQITVQGYTTQTNALQIWEQSDGTDVGSISNAGALDVASTVNYGSNDMYPLGYASSGYEMVCGSNSITGENQTITATGLTTVTAAIAVLATDPGTGAGDPALLTIDHPGGSSGTFVVNVWQDDWTTAATSAATIDWCAVGNE